MTTPNGRPGSSPPRRPGPDRRAGAAGRAGLSVDRTPAIARGAGTGLSGGANAIAGSVVVALDQMKTIRTIDTAERFAVVEPGVINDDLRSACAEHGLWYPPDPASSPWSTIGGNVATNAGGVCCVKYGVTRDYVLALQVVTAWASWFGSADGPPRASPATTSPRCWSEPRGRWVSSPRSPSDCDRPGSPSTPWSATSTRSLGPATQSPPWPRPRSRRRRWSCWTDAAWRQSMRGRRWA